MESEGQGQQQFVSLDLPDTIPAGASSNQLDFLPTNYDYSTTVSDSKSTVPNFNTNNFNLGYIGKLIDSTCQLVHKNKITC